MKSKITWKAVTKNTLTGQLEVNDALAEHPLNTEVGFMVRNPDGQIVFKKFDEAFLYPDTPDEGRYINLGQSASKQS